jgi:hypothetical protein
MPTCFAANPRFAPPCDDEPGAPRPLPVAAEVPARRQIQFSSAHASSRSILNHQPATSLPHVVGVIAARRRLHAPISRRRYSVYHDYAECRSSPCAPAASSRATPESNASGNWSLGPGGQVFTSLRAARPAAP